MKPLIKKLLRENLLNEKLADIDSDVDMLYTKYFEYDINEIQNTGIVRKDMFIDTEIDTSVLKSPECIEANRLNPCKILINKSMSRNSDNYYQPSTSTISLSINKSAINYIIYDTNGNVEVAIKMLPNERQQNGLRAELTEEKIKGSIHHELAHWIDDTLHNKHITKRVNKAMELGTPNVGGIPVNATKMEIQGQIHNVKQLYNKYKDIWDELTFNELIKRSPSLNSIYGNLSGEFRTKWLRDLKTRMHREGLLGKKMVN